MKNNKLIIYEDTKIQISSSNDAFDKIKNINIDYEQEHFIVFYLNNQNRIIKEEVLFKGGYDACLICPNTLFRKALLNNSNKIIIAHNHPSSSLNPSYEDIEMFSRLKELGDILNIDVMDSVIFNKEGYYSQI
jgi:DNA repair protein RadC